MNFHGEGTLEKQSRKKHGQKQLRVDLVPCTVVTKTEKKKLTPLKKTKTHTENQTTYIYESHGQPSLGYGEFHILKQKKTLNHRNKVLAIERR